MIVSPKKAASYKRQTLPQPPRPQVQQYTFPAPTNGWVLNDNLMTPSPASARVLDNFICTATSIRARGGFSKHATVATAAPVVSMFTYRSGSTEKFFAASSSAVYDISAPASTTVIPTAAFSGQTSGYYSTVQYGTAGGDFLYAVNGTDAAMLFNGTTWTQVTGVSSPAITGVATSSLAQVWSFASRIWFVEKNTLSAWYLPPDAVGGAATKFSLAGVFQRGGALVFGAAWSLDAGDGLDDKCIFVSDQGEVVVYQGSDPANASTWSKVGNYEISPPLGRNAYMQAGGDLLIATELGLVPISEAVRRDVAALSVGAVSRRIETYWQGRAGLYSATLPWEIKKWPSEGIMAVTQPEVTSTGGSMLVANLQTGAWSRFTGTDARCMGYFAGTLYFGNTTGAVFRMQSGGLDDTMPYTSVYLGQHESLGAQAREKTMLQMRPVFLSGSPIQPQLTVQVNHSESLSSPPNAAVYSATAGWDVSHWDVGLWDEAVGATVSAEDSRWVSIGRTGYVMAPELQLTFGGAALPDARLVGIDATFTVGAVVT